MGQKIFDESTRALLKEIVGVKNVQETKEVLFDKEGVYDTIPEVKIEEKESVVSKFADKVIQLNTDLIKEWRNNYDRDLIVDDKWALPYSKGKLNLLVASTNSGKTTYIASLALRAALEGKKILVLLTEDSNEDFGVLMPLRNEIDLTCIHTLELDALTDEDIVELVEFASTEGFEYVIMDYIESTAYETDIQDVNAAYKKFASTINKALQRHGKELYFFFTIQGNRNFDDEVGKSYMKLGTLKGKKADSGTYTAQELLEKIRKDFVSYYRTYIDGGVSMPQRAKGVVFSFNFGGLFFHIPVKEKTIGSAAITIGNIFHSAFDTSTNTIGLNKMQGAYAKRVYEHLDNATADSPFAGLAFEPEEEVEVKPKLSDKKVITGGDFLRKKDSPNDYI